MIVPLSYSDAWSSCWVSASVTPLGVSQPLLFFLLLLTVDPVAFTFTLPVTGLGRLVSVLKRPVPMQSPRFGLSIMGSICWVFREPCFMLPGPLCLLCHRTNISLLKLLLPEGLLGDRFLGPAPDILTLYVKNGLGMCILIHVILCEEISILYMRFVTYQVLWILRASSEVFSVLYARSGLFSDSLKTAAS